MENPVTELSKFAKFIVAKLTGDKATAIAIRNEKFAKSAVKQQINSLETEIVKQETKAEAAEEAFENVVYPTVEIEDTERYIENVVNAQKNLDIAKSKLKASQEDLAYFNKFLTEKF